MAPITWGPPAFVLPCIGIFIIFWATQWQNGDNPGVLSQKDLEYLLSVVNGLHLHLGHGETFSMHHQEIDPRVTVIFAVIFVIWGLRVVASWSAWHLLGYEDGATDQDCTRDQLSYYSFFYSYFPYYSKFLSIPSSSSLPFDTTELTLYRPHYTIDRFTTLQVLAGQEHDEDHCSSWCPVVSSTFIPSPCNNSYGGQHC